MSNDEGNPNEIFTTLGLDFKKEGGELVTECPFCGKAKFYLNEKRSVYDCKVCGATGNQHTILTRMVDKAYAPALRDAHYGRLATYRGLPEHAFRLDSNLGWDDVHSRMVWAVRRADGVVQGLRTWKDPGQGKKGPVHNLKGCKLGLLGAEALKVSKEATVYVCEGEWDRCGLLYLLDACAQPGIALAVPGANNFHKDWAEWLQGRDVVCLYDNDDAGRTGTTKVYKFLHGRAKRLRFIHWDTKKKDGYDVHDLVKENLDDPDKAWGYLQGSLKTEPTGKDMASSTGVLVEGDDRQKAQDGCQLFTVEQLHTTFHKWLKLDNCDLLDIVMGCFWSIHLQGNPLWMFIVAPPSGSKSETIMPASEWWKCHAVSNVTSKALISGFQMSGNADPSLLAALDGKRAVIAIKDLTPLLQGGQEERDEVFGILRDAYDGSISKVFGNGLKRTYTNLHFGLVAGVTPAIDAHGSTSMGERFLKFRADKDTDRVDDIERAVRAIDNCGQETAMRDELKAACVGALQREFKEENIPKPGPDFSRAISELAWCVANMRAVAPTEKGSDNQTMAPMVEAPPRLATQFVKLAQGLALHLELSDLMHPRILHLVRRVGLHTPDKVTTRIVQGLFLSKVPTTILGLSERVKGLSRETIAKVLMRLTRTGLLVTTKEEHTMYALTRVARERFDRTRIFYDIPTTDPFYVVQRLTLARKPATA